MRLFILLFSFCAVLLGPRYLTRHQSYPAYKEVTLHESPGSSPSPTPTPMPASEETTPSDTPTQETSHISLVYPNSRKESQDSWTSSDDPDIVTQWYKTAIEQM